MRNLQYHKSGINFVQINKTAARKLYNDGKTIILIASNMRAGAPWHPECRCKKTVEGNSVIYGEQSFESICNSFRYYNCTPETGRYIVFFTEEV